MAFVLDSSAGVSAGDWTNIKNFASMTATGFPLSSDLAQGSSIAVVSVGNSVDVSYPSI